MRERVFDFQTDLIYNFYMAITTATKKFFKVTLIVIVVFGMLAIYLAPLFSGGVQQRVQQQPVDFTGPTGAPFVNGPSAPPPGK